MIVALLAACAAALKVTSFALERAAEAPAGDSASAEALARYLELALWCDLSCYAALIAAAILVGRFWVWPKRKKPGAAKDG